jgi:hypothetical protein
MTVIGAIFLRRRASGTRSTLTPCFARIDFNYDAFSANALGRTVKMAINKAF